jgi:plasmid stabilization system protein ParE
VDFKVLITQTALDDLEEIVNYISQNEAQAAQRVAADLLRKAESLANMPRRRKAIRARPGVRRLVRNPYLIIYRIDEPARAVMVLRF